MLRFRKNPDTPELTVEKVKALRAQEMDAADVKTHRDVKAKYTLEDIKRLRTEENLSIDEIAERYGKSPGTISVFLKRKGYSIQDFPRGRSRSKGSGRPRKDYGITLEDVRRERAEGKSNSQIARALNMSASELNAFLSQQGVKLRDMDTGGVKVHQGPEARYTLEDIKRLRTEEGLSVREIGERLGVAGGGISAFLKRRDLSIKDIPRGGPRRKGSGRPRKDYGILIEDVERERAKGKTGSQIAEALDISTSDLDGFLSQQGVKLSDMDTGGHKVHKGKSAKYTVEDIKRLRAEEGLSVNEIGERLGVAGTNISEFLKRRDLSIKDFPKGGSRSNPMAQSGALPKAMSMSAGAGASVAISKVLDTRYPEMGLVKRSLISGGVPAGISLGVYAKTKNEAALWGLAGSIVGTAISAYFFKK